jgi:RecA/RadA recombinase
METVNKIKELVNSLEVDASKFFNKGNDSAGTRARKISQDLKSLLQDLRNEITAVRKTND